tara:strand:- start:7955 stop:8566 length:612 start_codon:yes stop_codon:yes gene_type:complete
MSIVLGSVYAGNIDYYCALSSEQNIIIDIYQHFQKQSYRNRCVIAGANGSLNLIVPVIRGKGKTALIDIKIDNSQNWKKIHWKSLESAYRTSPYFEFYEHEFEAIYLNKIHQSLFDFNNDMFNVILNCLQIEINVNFSMSYNKNYSGLLDLREIIHPKKSPSRFYNRPQYRQVFETKYTHLENLSVLDLLFNEGPRASELLLT